MQLHIARLCLDCEEIHDQQQCPVCASESYAFLSLWVTTSERRRVVRRLKPSLPTASVSTRQLAGIGIVGLAGGSLARWWWKTRQRIEASASGGAGELK